MGKGFWDGPGNNTAGIGAGPECPELLPKEALLDTIHQELLLKDSEALLVLHLVFHMAEFLDLSSTGGDRIQAGIGKKMFEASGKKSRFETRKSRVETILFFVVKQKV